MYRPATVVQRRPRRSPVRMGSPSLRRGTFTSPQRRPDPPVGAESRVAAGGTRCRGGGASGGRAGRRGPAVNAQFAYPQGVAVDASGALYIADTDNQRLRKVADGTISTVAGTGPGGFAVDGGPA